MQEENGDVTELLPQMARRGSCGREPPVRVGAATLAAADARSGEQGTSRASPAGHGAGQWRLLGAGSAQGPGDGV